MVIHTNSWETEQEDGEVKASVCYRVGPGPEKSHVCKIKGLHLYRSTAPPNKPVGRNIYTQGHGVLEKYSKIRSLTQWISRRARLDGSYKVSKEDARIKTPLEFKQPDPFDKASLGSCNG